MMRRPTRTSDLPRYIDPASIQIGDLIRVSWEDGDIEHARTATVGKREYEGQVRIISSEGGKEIFHWVPGQKHPRVTLLAFQKIESAATLFDLPDDVKDRIA